jgi:hypothetical protein
VRLLPPTALTMPWGCPQDFIFPRMAPNYHRENPEPEGQAGTPAQRKTRGTEGRQAGRQISNKDAS